MRAASSSREGAGSTGIVPVEGRGEVAADAAAAAACCWIAATASASARFCCKKCSFFKSVGDRGPHNKCRLPYLESLLGLLRIVRELQPEVVQRRVLLRVCNKIIIYNQFVIPGYRTPGYCSFIDKFTHQCWCWTRGGPAAGAASLGRSAAGRARCLQRLQPAAAAGLLAAVQPAAARSAAR